MSMNALVHNTAWVPGHFHTTLGGPTFLSFIAMTLFLVASLQGKKVAYPKLNVWVPYLWLIGVLIFSVGLSVGGLQGEPRRTNLGLTYLDPQSPLYQAVWKATSLMGAFGGIVMAISMVAFFWVLGATLLSKRTAEASLDFPTARAYHDEPAGVVGSFKPWLIAAIALLAITYIPPFVQIVRATGSTSSAFSPNSPIPVKR